MKEKALINSYESFVLVITGAHKIQRKTFTKVDQSSGFILTLNLNLNSLLVKRQVDNPSPGAVTGGN